MEMGLGVLYLKPCSTNDRGGGGGNPQSQLQVPSFGLSKMGEVWGFLGGGGADGVRTKKQGQLHSNTTCTDP